MIFFKQKISLKTAPCEWNSLIINFSWITIYTLVPFLKIFFDGSKMDVFNFKHKNEQLILYLFAF